METLYPRIAKIVARCRSAWHRAPRRLLTLALIAITTVLFGRVVWHEFTNYDDPAYVTANRRVQAGLTPESIRWAWTSLEVGNWHPLTWLSLELDASLFGLNPAGFHATNLLLHLANAVLLFWALERMTGSVVRASCVALLFAIHPLHVESVAWVAERKDLLGAFFWMLTMLAYAHYAKRPSLMRYLAVVVLFALGLAAKSMVVTLPCVLLLLDFWPLGRLSRFESGVVRNDLPDYRRPLSDAAPRRGKFQPAGIWWLVLEKAPLVALSAACGIITILAQRQGGAVSSMEHIPWNWRLMNACDAYLAYLWKAIYPLNLAVFYPHPMQKQVAGLAFVAAALLMAVTCWVCIGWRNRPFLAVGWFWFIGTLVPVIGLIQAGAQAIADRYTYLPLIGIFLAATWGCGELVRRRSLSPLLAGTLAVAAFVTFAACTCEQLGYWRDDVTLWRHALQVTGPNRQAYDGLGEALLRRGLAAEALPYLSESARRAPDRDGPHVNLGAALVELGRLPEGRQQLETAVRINPRNAMAHYNLGLVCGALGDVAEATVHWTQTLQFDRNHWKAHLALASILARQGAEEQEAEHIAAAERIDRAAARQFMRAHPSSFRDRARNEPGQSPHQQESRRG